MPGTRTDFGQMYDHELNPRKGWVGDRGNALEKVLPVATGMPTTVTLNAGCVVTAFNIGGDDVWVLGTANAADETALQLFPPAFAFQGENDFDVNPDLGNIAGGGLMALSCLGDFELESSAVGTGQTFFLGAPLTSARNSANPGTAVGASDGLIEVCGTGLGTDTICGIVSETGGNADGTFENEHGVDVVRFWTWYFPGVVPA